MAGILSAGKDEDIAPIPENALQWAFFLAGFHPGEKLGSLCFAYNDLFGTGWVQVHHQFTIQVVFNLPYGPVRKKVLAVGPVKLQGIQHTAQMLQGEMMRIGFAFFCAKLPSFFRDAEIHDTVCSNGDHAVAVGHQKIGFVLALQGYLRNGLPQQSVIKTAQQGLLQMLQLYQALPDLFFTNGFQQVVDTVGFESPEQVFIKSGAKHHRAGQLYGGEQVKDQPIAQLDIRKNKIGRRLTFQPFLRGTDGVKHRGDMNLRTHFQDRLFQIPGGLDFVLYDQDIHVSGLKEVICKTVRCGAPPGWTARTITGSGH